MTEKPGYLRAISLWNPHATLMVLGEKRLETRPQNTNIRGRVFIHSAQSRAWKPMIEQVEFFEALARHQVLPEDLKYGYILGSVEIIHSDRISSEDSVKCLQSNLTASEFAFGDYSVGRYWWETKNPQMLAKPIPFKGQQGFFWVPACCHCQKIPAMSPSKLCGECQQEPAFIRPPYTPLQI